MSAVNCQSWSGTTDCHSTDPFQDGDVGFKIWWMQNIPGQNNGIVYNGKPVKNWWTFVGDFDTAILDRTLP